MAEACPKQDAGRIYEHDYNEKQLSMTILNLVRGRRRGAISGVQTRRLNAAVLQQLQNETLTEAAASQEGADASGLGLSHGCCARTVREGKANSTGVTAEMLSIPPSIQGGSECCQAAVA